MASWLRYRGLTVPWLEQFYVGPEWVLGSYTLVVLLVLLVSGAYRADRLRPLSADLRSAAQAGIAIGVLAFAALAILKLHGASRLLVGYVVALHAIFLVGREGLESASVTEWPRSANPSAVGFLHRFQRLVLDAGILGFSRHPVSFALN